MYCRVNHYALSFSLQAQGQAPSKARFKDAIDMYEMTLPYKWDDMSAEAKQWYTEAAHKYNTLREKNPDLSHGGALWMLVPEVPAEGKEAVLHPCAHTRKQPTFAQMSRLHPYPSDAQGKTARANIAVDTTCAPLRTLGTHPRPRLMYCNHDD